jgi:hypothetical protein
VLASAGDVGVAKALGTLVLDGDDDIEIGVEVSVGRPIGWLPPPPSPPSVGVGVKPAMDVGGGVLWQAWE